MTNFEKQALSFSSNRLSMQQTDHTTHGFRRSEFFVTCQIGQESVRYVSVRKFLSKRK